MDSEKDKEVNLKRFKGHYRKFPWSLIIKSIIVAFVIAMIFYISDAAIKKQNKQEKEDFELEIAP